jgi:uncharacterized protein (TIGR02687 family)
VTDKIAQSLTAQFAKHRIVFWYDTERDMREEFERLDLEGVTKVEIDNNEFGLKHRILRKEPDTLFLIYKHGPKPANMIDNWLLDVELAHTEFRTDRVQSWLVELGLGVQCGDTLKSHEAFFRSAKRLEALKSRIRDDHTPRALRIAMLSVLFDVPERPENITEQILFELAEETLAETWKTVERCNLTDSVWAMMAENYGYQSDDLSIEDFALTLFKSCYAIQLNDPAALSAEALVMFKRWKTSTHYSGAFEALSKRFEDVLNIKSDLEARDFRSMVEIDHFEAIERWFLKNLIQDVADKTISPQDVASIIRKRRRLHWASKDDYRHIYEAVGYAAKFQSAINVIHIGMDSLSDGVRQYTETGYEIDQIYRKFIFHVRKSGQHGLLSGLTGEIENLYSNRFLLPLNDAWQNKIDEVSKWKIPDFRLQRDFFAKFVRPNEDKPIKTCVLISDALRYEIGEELQRRIKEQDRFDAQLTSMISMLPSYTQLGMASLLPNSELEINPNTTGVSVDGLPANGLAGREKILSTHRAGERCKALKYNELMEYGVTNAKELIRDHDILYIYHDRIDAIGDDTKTEANVFEAVEETFNDLVSAARLLMSANATRILIIADHGFIFQNHALEESDYSSAKVDGADIGTINRRFVLGKGIESDPALKAFTAGDLGLAGDIEIAIPKSINRLRRSGSGSRFVHGGASLQEIVIPVLTVTKSRQSDVSNVEIDVIEGSSRTISTNQQSIRLYQTEAVTEKRQPRTLRIGFYSADNELLSDQQTIDFNSVSENPREREHSIRLIFSKAADAFNQKHIYLKLEEPHGGTSHFREYKKLQYMLRRSLGTDFDF